MLVLLLDTDLEDCSMIELNELNSTLHSLSSNEMFTLFISVKQIIKIKKEGKIPLKVLYFDPTVKNGNLLAERTLSFSSEEYPLISDLIKKVEPIIFDAEYEYSNGKKKLLRKGVVVSITMDGKILEKSSKSSDYISYQNNILVIKPELFIPTKLW